MVERQDIDALLISALYGELTPVEETRLAAHLDSHPADRTALDDLTRARTALHESRILQVQLDPPQSISALLMQEAARRAPKKPSEAGEGWFARFVRTFASHPAMAAAAMLVVVVGFAALVSRQQDRQFAETEAVSTVPTASEPASTDQAAVTGKQDQDFRLSAGEGDRLGKDNTGQAAGSGAVGAPMPPTESYRVGLDDSVQSKVASEREMTDKVQQQKAALAEKEARTEALNKRDSLKVGGYYDEGASNVTKDVITKGEAKKSKPSKVDSFEDGLELRSPTPAPKELDSTTKQKIDGKARGLADEKQTESVTGRVPQGVAPGVAGQRDFGGGGAAAGSTRPDAPAPAADPSATANRPAIRSAPNQNAQPAPPPANTTPPTPKSTAKPTTAPTATPKPAPPTTSKTAVVRDERTKNETKSGEKTVAPSDANDKATNDPLLAWAKERHAAVIAQVRAGKCREAANIAVSIANRHPSYYGQNVETDRSVKECLAYINSERERDAELRAQKTRSKKLNTEPAPKRAVDAKPADAAKTDAAK